MAPPSHHHVTETPKALHSQSVGSHRAGYKSPNSQEWGCLGQTLRFKDEENCDAQYSPARLVIMTHVPLQSWQEVCGSVMRLCENKTSK